MRHSHRKYREMTVILKQIRDPFSGVKLQKKGKQFYFTDMSIQYELTLNTPTGCRMVDFQ